MVVSSCALFGDFLNRSAIDEMIDACIGIKILKALGGKVGRLQIQCKRFLMANSLGG